MNVTLQDTGRPTQAENMTTNFGLGHLLRHPSKIPFKEPFPQSGSHTIIDCECPALRRRVPYAEKVVIKGGLIKWPRPKLTFSRDSTF